MGCDCQHELKDEYSSEVRLEQARPSPIKVKQHLFLADDSISHLDRSPVRSALRKN